MPFVRGHALYMQALPGGQAKHDKIDSQTSAARLRGGLLPQASGSPAERRATRDLLRRRTHLTRTRAELVAHVHNTHRQDNLPEIGKNIAYQAKRHGVAERVADPAVHKRIEVDLALITYDDQLLTARERSSVKHAQHHDANTFYRLRAGPGVGKILALVRRDAIHDLHRFPRGQDFVSDGRLVKGAKASAGTRYGTSGKQIGQASLQWAFSDAAVLCRRTNPAGQTCLAQLANKPGTGNALTLLAHKLARAVSDRRKRQTVVEMETCLHREREQSG
jgi:hypothetical protein